MFRSVGSLYELRLMLDFSGANKGFCYARYATLADADKALRSVSYFFILCRYR